MTVRTGRSKAAVLPSPTAAHLPQVIEPMLSVAAPEPFDSPAHIFEVLWEGVRALAFVERGGLRLQDRWGRDITHRYPDLSRIPSRVRESGVVIDGAIVCLDSNGRPDFLRLCERIGLDGTARVEEAAVSSPVVFQAFDVLYRERQPLTGWTLRRRKEMLRGLVRPDAHIAVPDDVARDGVAFFEAAREHGLLGIIAKESESRYLPGERSRAWLTVHARNQAEFVIGGYTYGGRWHPRGGRPKREEFASLLLGVVRDDGRLDFAGEVTGGFQSESRDLVLRLDDATAPHCPFAQPPALERLVFWCRPEVAATVGYAEWTEDGRLRFPVFRALRPDVPVSACVKKDT